MSLLKITSCLRVVSLVPRRLSQEIERSGGGAVHAQFPESDQTFLKQGQRLIILPARGSNITEAPERLGDAQIVTNFATDR